MLSRLYAGLNFMGQLFVFHIDKISTMRNNICPNYVFRLESEMRTQGVRNPNEVRKPLRLINRERRLATMQLLVPQSDEEFGLALPL
ncbi:hypothetical protein ACZ91_69290 [Streptomyces regensis]|nr:hypothetical protein ACZ91_69290 [Streptomyces regensis]